MCLAHADARIDPTCVRTRVVPLRIQLLERLRCTRPSSADMDASCPPGRPWGPWDPDGLRLRLACSCSGQCSCDFLEGMSISTSAASLIPEPGCGMSRAGVANHEV